MIHTHDYKRLTEKISPCKKILIWIFITLFFVAIAHTILPLLIQQTLFTIFSEKNATAIQNSLLIITGVLIIRVIADFYGRVLTRKAGNCLCTQLNTALFDIMLNLSPQQYQRLDADQITRTTLSQINKVARSTIQMINVLVRDSLIIAGLILYLTWLDKDFAGIVALLIPFTLIMRHIAQKHQSAIINLNTPPQSPLTNQLQRLIKHFKLIRLYGAQHQEYQRLITTLESMQNTNDDRANNGAFIVTLCQLVTLLIIIAIAYLMVQLILNDQFTVDQMGAFIATLLLLIAPIDRMARLPQTLKNTQKHLQQILKLLDQPTTSEHNKTTLHEVHGKLTFKHVSFFNQKTENSLLYRLDLEIKPNETIAFICQSQHTRSQLIDLMLGFQQPATGQILLDDVPIEIFKQTNLLTHFAMVSQESVILNDTVAGNIAYGSTECTHENHITSAAQAVGVSNFVREMPNGLQTCINENGANITRLQQQKIAIARALLKNSPILIIDNLWLQPNQTSLNEALITLMEKRTTILLTDSIPVTGHPIDRVFLLNNGLVTEHNS